MSKIIANRIKTPDGTILQSFHRYDYKSYTDKNGLTYMVDGGNDCMRRTVHMDAPYDDMTVYIDDPFQEIREAFHWGTRGKDGKQPLKWKPLCKLADDHLAAIIETQTQISEELLNIFKQEVEWRKQHEI